MAFMNALPSPQLGKAAAAVVKQKPLAGEDFYASALTPSSVGPAATDASSSGPGYGVPAPSYAPAIQLSGGYTPDYNALINNDPGLTAFRGTEKMTADQADSARRAAVRALAVQYGGLPSGLADPYGDVDAGTLDLAKSNQFSDVANLARNYAQTVEGIKRSLAARGALQSSELAYGLDQANLGRGQAEYTMGQNFANAFQTAINNYVGRVNDLRQQEAQAISQAAANVYGNPANRPSDAVMANYDGGASSQYGQVLYRGPNGALYTVDGSVFSPPSGGSSDAQEPARNLEYVSDSGSSGTWPGMGGAVQNAAAAQLRADAGAPVPSLADTVASLGQALGAPAPAPKKKSPYGGQAARNAY